MKISDDIKGFFLCFAIISAAIYAGYYISESKCHARYSVYGQTSYEFMKGCQVLLKDGRAIPTSTIREQVNK